MSSTHSAYTTSDGSSKKFTATGAGGWGDNTFQDEPYEGFFLKEQGMECHGNLDTINMNNILLTNAKANLYFKGLSVLRTFDATVDKIYYDVDCLAPWVPGSFSQRCSAVNATVPYVTFQMLSGRFVFPVP